MGSPSYTNFPNLRWIFETYLGWSYALHPLMLRMASLFFLFPLACSPMKAIDILSIIIFDRSSTSSIKHKCHINWENQHWPKEEQELQQQNFKPKKVATTTFFSFKKIPKISRLIHFLCHILNILMTCDSYQISPI